MSSASIMAFTVSELRRAVPGRSVVEIGAAGSERGIRDLLAPYGPASYVGVDLLPGPRVDLVADLLEQPSRIPKADIVICTEVLEHVPDWRGAVRALKGLVKQGGWLLVTTRSRGFRRHSFPHDCWRFSVKNFEDIFCDLLELRVVDDPLDPGVFACGRKLDDRFPAELDGIEPEPAPSEPTRMPWFRYTLGYLVRATGLGLWWAGPVDAARIFRQDYPTRLKRMAGVWRWPS